MSDILISVGIVLALILFGGVFAAAEIALVSLRESQVRALAAKSKRGQRVAKLAENPNRFLAAVQIGVTFAGFLSAAFGEARLSSRLEPVFIGAGMSRQLADVLALIVITLIVAYFSLVFGELAPKRLALQRPEGIAQVLAGPLDRVASLARPAIWLLSRSTNAVVRLVGGDPGAGREAITEEELRGLVAAHEALSRDERILIEEVFSSSDRQVREVMVPRTEVDFLEAGMTVSRAARIAWNAPHSRYPVVGESQDDVIGFVHIRDLVSAPTRDRARTVRDVSREIARLPGTKNVLSALSEMRRAGHHIAIIVDEYGGTAGVVTLEDLIEEVIGDIRDEYDEPAGEPAGARGHRSEVDGLLNLDDFAEETGVTLPDGPYETAAGYVMAALGALPQVGDAVEVDGHIVTVCSLDGRRIARLQVRPADEPAEEPAEEAAEDAADEPAEEAARVVSRSVSHGTRSG